MKCAATGCPRRADRGAYCPEHRDIAVSAAQIAALDRYIRRRQRRRERVARIRRRVTALLSRKRR